MIINLGRAKYVIDKNTGERINEPEVENFTGTDTEQTVRRAGGNSIVLADANTGRRIRMYRTEQSPVGEPVLHNGVIYVCCEEGMVYAFSTESEDALWKSKPGAALQGKPGIGDGRVYAGSSDGKLFALNAGDGTVLWTYQDEHVKGNTWKYYSLPIESNDRIYIGTAGSELLCINSQNGERLWKLQVSDWIRSSPLLIKGKIHVATLCGDMYAVKDNGNSAEVIKQVKLAEHGFTADLVGNENGILAAGGDLILYSVSPESLKLNWKHGIIDGVWIDGEFVMADWTGGLQPTPSIVDGIVYCGGLDGFVHAIDSETGKEIWRFETGGRSSAAITVAEGKVFFGQIGGEGIYYALDKNTGEVIWKSEEFDNVWVGPSYTGNGLFFGNMEGMMYGVNPEDGSVIWTYDTAKDTPKENWRNMNKRGHGWPPGIYPMPVADATKVYIGSWSGYYFAFDQKTGKLVWRTQTNNGNLNGGLPDSAALVLWKGHVYVQKLGQYLTALRTDDGSIAWEWRAPRPFLQNGTVVAHDDKIFASYAHRVTASPYNSTIIAFKDVENGSEELWRYKGGGGLTAPVITDGKLITGSSCDPFVVCLNPQDGSVLWRYYTGGEMMENVPAIYGNKFYAHFNTGWLCAIQ
jgi:outer membrane protein assembly factor BamB